VASFAGRAEKEGINSRFTGKEGKIRSTQVQVTFQWQMKSHPNDLIDLNLLHVFALSAIL
jgi:hypothetical protein